MRTASFLLVTFLAALPALAGPVTFSGLLD